MRNGGAEAERGCPRPDERPVHPPSPALRDQRLFSEPGASSPPSPPHPAAKTPRVRTGCLRGRRGRAGRGTRRRRGRPCCPELVTLPKIEPFRARESRTRIARVRILKPRPPFAVRTRRTPQSAMSTSDEVRRGVKESAAQGWPAAFSTPSPQRRLRRSGAPRSPAASVLSRRTEAAVTPPCWWCAAVAGVLGCLRA